jgi:hypothetical protein
MTAYAKYLFPGLAGLLLLVLAAEWLLPGTTAPMVPRSPAIPSTMADSTSDADIAQWSSTILARPLLSLSRRPAPVAGADASNSLPRLSAIIVIGGTRRAIFADSGQKPQLVSEGGEIGDYRVKTVAPDRVDVLGPGGPMTLKPQFIPAAPAQPAASQ